MVTGGCGFIGSHVVELFNHKGHEVFIMDDLSTGHDEWVKSLIGKRSVHFDISDICRNESVHSAFAAFRPDTVCHLAAQPAISTSWGNPLRNAEVNEIGTLNIVEAMRAYGTRRIIFASTSAVYKETKDVMRENSPKEPNTPYGISKLAAESYLRILTSAVILRLGNVYGPRQFPLGENQVIPRILSHFLKGTDFAIHGDGKQKRDFVYVEDVADAFLLACWGKPGVYNIASGTRYSVNQLAGGMETIFDVPGYHWEHTHEQDARRDVRLDISTAQRELGWKPRRVFRDGLEVTSKWWKERNGKK